MAWFDFLLGNSSERAKERVNTIRSLPSIEKQVKVLKDLYDSYWKAINKPPANFTKAISDLENAVLSKKKLVESNLKTLRDAISPLRGHNDYMKLLDNLITEYSQAETALKNLAAGILDLRLTNEHNYARQFAPPQKQFLKN